MGFSLSYKGELRKPHMWPQGSPVSIRVARGEGGIALESW